MVIEKVRERTHKHTISVKNALSGIFWVAKTQHNFQIHLVVTVLVLVLAFVFNLSTLEFTILVVAIVLVLVAEMINTAVESMTDLIYETHHVRAKVAKDVSAGMVLLTSLGAVILAALIFLPHIF